MEGFSKVAQRSEITAGALKLVEVGGEQIVLADLGGTVIAFSNVCTHADCDLAYGALDGEEIECDCHGSVFNARTGEVLTGPATTPLPTYAVRIEGSDVLVGPA
ncbi:MAG: Rieske 2Fe-2S domain-containing protein [Chloroflexi bacterium]|nr:Rieske 2Fe-2S domain-containing protein [Chloroflexota bacterium]